MEKGFEMGENRISLFFVESPHFFSWLSRFSFTRGWQVCKPIRANENIEGIKIGEDETRSLLYADDVTATLAIFHQSKK